MATADVAALLHGTSPNADEVLGLFHVMCRSVQRIHQLQIAHRDLKPSNFLVMQGGNIVLSDFGTARQFTGGSGPLLSDYKGLWPGDYGYVAPEILAGLHDGDATLAYGADTFALGAILFELLTGSLLQPLVFDADDLVQLQAIAVVRDPAKRREIFESIATALRDGRPLPSVRAVTGSVPKCVTPLLDGLYQSMAALDFRERARDYQDIFRRIAVCRLVLRNEAKVRRWLEMKRKRRNKVSGVASEGDSD